MLRSERNPGMVSAPIINNAIKTEIPINTLFWAVMYWPTIPIKMINPRNIKNDTKVRPEKKLSEIKETKIKISIRRIKANTFHLLLLIVLKKKFSSFSSGKFFSSTCPFFGN